MTAQITWTIKQMSTVPQLDGESDVVVSAVWQATGIESGFSAFVNGVQQFTLQQGETFTPYDQLTQQQVIDWVQQAMGANGVTSINACLEGQLDSMINPPPQPAPQPLPWGN
jgi:hypothetical protein